MEGEKKWEERLLCGDCEALSEKGFCRLVGVYRSKKDREQTNEVKCQFMCKHDEPPRRLSGVKGENKMGIHERKYMIQDGQLVKRIGEIPVPDDEPLFIFRAKDRKALPVLVAYNMILDNLDQKAEVTKSINDFRAFQEKNPEKMGEPSP